MRSLIAKVGEFVATATRHAVPLGGLFGLDWHPATALVVYWLETVLLALVAAGLCAMVRRKTPPSEVVRAGINPRDVLGFHVGSMVAFGGFFAGVLVILVGNGHIEPLRWGELREGAQVMLVAIALALTFDLWDFKRFGVDAARERVDACTTRWGLFWMVGFFGTMAMMYTGRPAILFGFFAGLKVFIETYGRIARMFGWRSTQSRAQANPPTSVDAAASTRQ